MLTVPGRLTGLSRDPLPDLGGLRFVDEDDQVFVGGLGDLLLDLAPGRVVRNAAVSPGGHWST